MPLSVVPGACTLNASPHTHSKNRTWKQPANSPPANHHLSPVQALMPVAVFSVGCVFGTDKFHWSTMSNMLLVTLGVAIASFGERSFVPTLRL